MRLGLKLAGICAAVTVIPILILSLIVLSEVSSHARASALEQLRSDARAVGALCEKRQIEMRAAAQFLADEISNRALVSGDNLDRNSPAAWARLQDMLPRAQTDASLDFVIITKSSEASVCARGNISWSRAHAAGLFRSRLSPLTSARFDISSARN